MNNSVHSGGSIGKSCDGTILSRSMKLLASAMQREISVAEKHHSSTIDVHNLGPPFRASCSAHPYRLEHMSRDMKISLPIPSTPILHDRPACIKLSKILLIIH